ncbi:MAG TPA: FkbM family methyltransferase [Gemmataceae bacterium]|nr:FkbM family methyltransferase [Gemmataceae bacterium]
MNAPSDSWFTLLANSILGVQPFSAQRREWAHKQIARRFLNTASRTDYAEALWDSLPQWMQAISFRRDNIIWTGSVRSQITRQLFLAGGFQKEEIDQLLAWLGKYHPHWNRRTTIINVGANIGDTCIPMALASQKSFVACEPVPETFLFLCRNVADNRLSERIRCRQLAISATAEKLTMVLPDEPGQCEVQGPEGKQGYPLEHYQAGTVEVSARTLDALVNMEGILTDDVALVWTDTQGYESDVLQSGRSLWLAGVSAWVEVWPAGLNAQGGIDRFLDVCRQFFRHFVDARALLSGQSEPRTIGDLAALVASLGGLDHTDVLLLP